MAVLEKVKKVPSSPDEFKEYILEYCKPTIGFGSEFEMNYKFNVANLRKEFKSSGFWKDLKEGLPEMDALYRKENSGLDLIPNTEIEINEKEVVSAIQKAYRISILNNKEKSFSQDYYKEFILPENIFEKLNDILRTEIIVKYVDGIEKMVVYLQGLANKYNFQAEVEKVSKEEGYYAQHFYIKYKTRISDFSWVAKEINFSFEVQIRTQLQDTIKSILHWYYKKDRVKLEKDQIDKEWRWHFESPKFITNYIGHILHFFDGIIVSIKNKKEV